MKPISIDISHMTPRELSYYFRHRLMLMLLPRLYVESMPESNDRFSRHRWMLKAD